ncbi:MAG: hypothetical protein FWC26_08940 [Fibromonadales bacterium]|nr:hypothetical protein [Fibromonadales bacterium]
MGKIFKAIVSTTSCLFLLFFVILVSCSDYEAIDPYTREGAPANPYSSSEGLSSSSLGEISSSSEDILSSSSEKILSSSSGKNSSSSEKISSSSVVILSSSSEEASSSSSEGQSSSSVALCGSEIYEPSTQFCDTRDNRLYKYVTINNVIWMAENLNYDIPDDPTDVCYGNNPTNCTVYGRLYSWDAILEYNEDRHDGEKIRGVCPENWHIPSETEWGELINNNEVTNLREESHWDSSRGGYVPGKNTTGFSALPGGYLSGDQVYWDLGTYGLWWNYVGSSAEAYVYINYKSENLIDFVSAKNNRYSVRCVMD